MLNLPESERAVVPWEKSGDYLLAREHPDGGPKAEFFTDHGFVQDRPGELVEALLRHGQEHPITKIRETPWGTRYTVEGKMLLPDGSEHLVQTVWQFDIGTDFPRLITAHAV